MANPIHRPQFLFDVAEELNWLNQKAGPEVADRWYEKLCSTIDQLKKHPAIGRPRPDLRPEGIRSWRVKGFARWLVFYLQRGDDIVLLRVRQGTMNLSTLEMGK